jgi:hypothetical protein
MVIYQSMVIDLDTLDMADPVLEIDHNELTTDGKRGNVSMAFNFLSAGQVVGRGEKHMVLGGLREYEEQAMTAAILRYNERKMAFAMSNG